MIHRQWNVDINQNNLRDITELTFYFRSMYQGKESFHYKNKLKTDTDKRAPNNTKQNTALQRNNLHEVKVKYSLYLD